jgi:ribonuclease P protein component
MDRLKQRADFLAVAKGAKAPAGAFVLQARERGDAAPSRFGFTVSKKVGTAAERNRVRRRLREIVRRNAALLPESGHDYVLIGRRAALGMPFGLMVSEFLGAMTRLARSDGRPLKAPHG